MRPMSMREMHALCYERGLEFDPAMVPVELGQMAEATLGTPAYLGRSAAQELYERRVAQRRERRGVPEWFSAQDVVWESWERETLTAA